MRVILDVTPSEYQAVHDLVSCSLLLAPDDYDKRRLHTFLDKWRRSRDQAVCETCDRHVIYAKGKCRRCYMRNRRKVVDVA